MVLKSSYRGFVAPAFVPYNEEGELNLAEIPKYSQYLLSKNVMAVLVSGTVGEGPSLSIDERKSLAEAWMSAASKNGQKVMVQVGGTHLRNVVQLAKHAEAIGAWSILCLPELFFRPKTIEELIDYLKIVGAAAPKTPLFYYHYPLVTGVTLDMPKFLEAAYSEIPTLSGLKYTHNNLDEGFRCVQFRDRTFAIFLGADQLASAAFCMGFDSVLLTVLNYGAEEVHAIKENIASGNIPNAQKIQNRIRNLTELVEKEAEWVNGFKKVISLITKLKLGSPRPPLKDISPDTSNKLEKHLKEFGWMKN